MMRAKEHEAMALFVDCAFLDDLRPICEHYPVSGVTTNPSILLAAAQRGQRLADVEVLRELLALCTGPVFMQPTVEGADDAAGLRAAADRYIAVAPERVVPKLPPTEAGMAAGMALVRAGARVAYTATCSLAQVYCAAQAGASWVIPYFGRMRRAGEDPCERVTRMARLVAQQAGSGGQTRVLVASVKSAGDVIEATMAGAHDVTAPPEVIRALLADALSTAAFEQFQADWRTLQQL
jgi:TalC/MipB family fructose-6-phosphate aldolase